ncbi:hypothetical protein R3P38DRAFT_3532196 [Favolaschia claudopus]|uniref:Uncharacterized protein n=1 Tax=Favolaschia claudopus TaxID=2862362 RepID=A0AAW0BES7_9AGAR
MHTPLRDDLKDSSASPSPADYIDDEAVLSGVEEEDESEDDSIVNIDDPNEEDIAFINDSSDLSIHSDRELTKPSFASQEIDMDSDSDLSDLPLNLMKAVPPPKDDAAQDSDDDVIVVPTPSKLKGVRKRSRRLAHANTDEEDAAITPGDSMFDRGSAVKASTLPPPVATRSTRSASSNASDKSAVKAVAATKGNTAPKESPSSTAEGTPAKERPKPRKRAKTGKNDDGKDAQQPSGAQEGAAAVQSNSAGQPATPGDKAAQQPAVLSSDYLRDLLGEMLPAIQAAAAAPAVPSLPATSSTSQSAVNAASVVVPLATALPAAQPATIIRETTPLGQEPAGPNVSPGQMVNAVLENEDPRPAYSGQNGTSPRPPQEDDHGVLLSPFKAPTTPVDRNGKLAAWKESQANSNIRNMFMSSAASAVSSSQKSSGVSDIAVAPQLPSGTDTPPTGTPPTGAPQANGSSVSENAIGSGPNRPEGFTAATFSATPPTPRPLPPLSQAVFRQLPPLTKHNARTTPPTPPTPATCTPCFSEVAATSHGSCPPLGHSRPLSATPRSLCRTYSAIPQIAVKQINIVTRFPCPSRPPFSTLAGHSRHFPPPLPLPAPTRLPPQLIFGVSRHADDRRRSISAVINSLAFHHHHRRLRPTTTNNTAPSHHAPLPSAACPSVTATASFRRRFFRYHQHRQTTIVPPLFIRPSVSPIMTIP